MKTNKTLSKLQSNGFVTAVLVALLACATIGSQGQVVLRPKNSNGLYQVGEKAVWTVKPASESTATNATYAVRKNGTTQIQQGTLDLSSGSATIEAGLDEPGELVLSVTSTPSEANSTTTSTNATENAARGSGRGGRGQTRDGAIVDAGHLKPSLPRPDDFDAWWEKKLAALDAVPANPQLEQTNVDVGGIEYYKVTLDNINGTHVHGQLAKPAKEGKFPASSNCNMPACIRCSVRGSPTAPRPAGSRLMYWRMTCPLMIRRKFGAWPGRGSIITRRSATRIAKPATS